MSTEQIAEQANEEIAESIGLQPPKRKRKARKLTWNERQYGAGLVAGIGVGICIGIPLDAVLAVAAKWFVTWLTTW